MGKVVDIILPENLYSVLDPEDLTQLLKAYKKKASGQDWAEISQTVCTLTGAKRGDLLKLLAARNKAQCTNTPGPPPMDHTARKGKNKA